MDVVVNVCNYAVSIGFLGGIDKFSRQLGQYQGTVGSQETPCKGQTKRSKKTLDLR